MEKEIIKLLLYLDMLDSIIFDLLHIYNSFALVLYCNFQSFIEVLYIILHPIFLIHLFCKSSIRV